MLYQPPPREAYSPPHISIDGINLNASPHISIDGINLNAVEHLAYQGSVMSNDATVSKNLDTRLSKASSFFGRLSKRVWLEAFALLLRENPGTQNRRHSHPPLPEADQATWAGSSTLLSLHPWHGVARLRVRRRSPQESSLPSIDSILLQVQLRLAGHFSRTEDTRMPKPVFFSELQNGKRDC